MVWGRKIFHTLSEKIYTLTKGGLVGMVVDGMLKESEQGEAILYNDSV